MNSTTASTAYAAAFGAPTYLNGRRGASKLALVGSRVESLSDETILGLDVVGNYPSPIRN